MTRRALLPVLLCVALVALVGTASAAGQLSDDRPLVAKSAASGFQTYLRAAELLVKLLRDPGSLSAEELAAENLPANIRLVVQRSLALSRDFSELVEKTRLGTSTASGHLQAGDTTAARQAAAQSQEALTEAQGLGAQLAPLTTPPSANRGPTNPFLSRIARRAPPDVAAVVNQVTTEVEDTTQRVRSQEAAETNTLTRPDISLALSKETLQPGERFRVSGVLQQDGIALAKRQVIITVDGQTLGDATTQPNGSYDALVDLPGIYRLQATLGVTFRPSGADVTTLAPTTTTRTVTVTFTERTLEVESPVIVFSGHPAGFRGRVEPSRPNDRVEVLMGERSLGSFPCASPCTIPVTVPFDASPATTAFTFRLAAAGALAPAQAIASAEVRTGPARLTATVPDNALAPGEVAVRVRATPPLPAGRLRVRLGDATVERTVEPGTGDITLTVSPGPFALGQQGVTVQFEPADALIPASSSAAAVVLFNLPAAASGAALCFGFLLMAARRRWWDNIALLPQPGPAVAPAPAPWHAPATDPLLTLYWRAIAWLEARWGALSAPTQTLRERLAAAENLAQRPLAPLRSLTDLAERHLYGRSRIPVDPAQAEPFVEQLEQTPLA